MNNFRSQRKSEKKEWDEGLLVEKAVLNQSNCLEMKIDLNYIQRFSSYCTLNTCRFGATNQVNVVQVDHHMFCTPPTAHKFSAKAEQKTCQC